MSTTLPPPAIASIDVDSGPSSVGATQAFDDVLVFEHRDRGFDLVGARGHRAGWVGIVELRDDDSGLVEQSWRHGTTQRLSGRRPSHVAGPYYARHGVAVPVGHRHVVVYGANRPITLRDTELIKLAASEVDRTHGVSADKLLADELELVHALRTLMAYRPLTVRDTVRHVATIAAEALSCELAVVRVELDGQAHVEGLDVRSKASLADPDPGGYLGRLDAAHGAIVEQVAPSEPDIFGIEVASRLTIPLAGSTTGAIALGHAVARPRGFTSLCQRIARAVADAAELLISQAHAREQLSSERDLLARLVRTDPLTGGANRRVWEDEVERGSASAEGHLLSCDIDGLKAVNDRFGHAAGDALIRGAYNLLRSCVRDGDLVARVGGDEFVVLIRSGDPLIARRVTRRIGRAERAWRVTEYGLSLRLSIGCARIAHGDLAAAWAAADRLMYAAKRRRMTGHETRSRAIERRTLAVQR
jgi:diguanylate cyclase (GGDEF)-like protein